MKNFLKIMPFFIAGLLFWGPIPALMAEETPIDNTVTLEKGLHFLAPDGSDVLLNPGDYEVDAAQEWLQLIPSGGDKTDAILIEAESSTHEEDIKTTQALIDLGETEDLHHLVLLLPEGKTLEALGTVSGIRPRGFKFLRFSKSRYKSMVQRKRTLLQKKMALKFKRKRQARRPTQAQASGQGFSLDLVEIHCRKIWYKALGNHDLVVMSLWAYDTGSEESQFVTFTFKCRNDQKYHLNMTRLFGPTVKIKGELRISGNFMVTHPKKFKNIRDAIKKMVDIEAATVGIVAKLTGLGGGGVAAFGTGPEFKVLRDWHANLRTEVVKFLGKAICLGGGDSITYTKSIGLKPLDQQWFKRNANKQTKLWYISYGKKRQTCWRGIKYDLHARVLRK